MSTGLTIARIWWAAITHPRAAGAFVLEPPARRFEWQLALGIAAAYAVYGSTMGITRGGFPAVISAVKLPMLYILTLAVCFPCFYALNGMFGLRLQVRSCIRLLLLAVSANAVALLSYAPVSLFFSLTTSTATLTGYRFMLLMHFCVFSVAGSISLGIIVMIFRQAALVRRVALRPAFMAAFAMVYAVVGLQMAWVLRPWVGSWMVDYQPFRPMESSVFEQLGRLFLDTAGAP